MCDILRITRIGLPRQSIIFIGLILCAIAVGIFTVLGVNMPMLYFGSSIGVFALVMGLFRPFAAMCVYVFLVPFEDALSVPGVITFTKMLGISLLVGWLLELVIRRTKVCVPRELWLFSLWLIYSASLLIKVSLTEIPSHIITLIMLMTFLVVGYNLGDSQNRVKILVYSTAAGAIASSFLGLLMLSIPSLQQYGTLSGSEAFLSENRLAIASAGPIHFGNSLLIGFCFCWTIMRNAKRTFAKVTMFLALCLIGYIIITTGSRSTMLGMAMAAVFLAVRNTKEMVTLSLLCLIVYFNVDNLQGWLGRWNTAMSSGGSERLGIWKVAFQIFKEHPIIGVGFDQFSKVFPYFRDVYGGGGYLYNFRLADPHNMYIQVICEGGIIGGLLFFGYCGIAVAKVLHLSSLRETDRQVTFIADGILAGNLALFVSAFFTTILYRKYFWVGLMMLAVLQRIDRKKRSPSLT